MINRNHLNGEQTIFLKNIKKNAYIDNKFVLEEKEKLLKACADIAILTEMTERKAMSATDIILFFEKNYEVSLSPGTVYPILYRLEGKGYIRLLLNRKKKTYVLAESSRKAMKDLQQRIVEIQSFIIFLIHK
jgi:DNA-binding PadR family transcriptional regulator